MALATQAEGVSVIEENIFENRFMHVQELVRMGQHQVEGRTATVRGPAKLSAGRHVLGPASLGVAGFGRADSRRRVHPGPRLSHGSRL